MEYSNGIDESVFKLDKFVKSFCNPPEPFINVRTDWYVWELKRDPPELTNKFVTGLHVKPLIWEAILIIIERHWDCFYGAGVMIPILYFKFGIDTDASLPVCCKKPQYGSHERKIIMHHPEVLKSNCWIRKCFGP